MPRRGHNWDVVVRKVILLEKMPGECQLTSAFWCTNRRVTQDNFLLQWLYVISPNPSEINSIMKIHFPRTQEVVYWPPRWEENYRGRKKGINIKGLLFVQGCFTHRGFDRVTILYMNIYLHFTHEKLSLTLVNKLTKGTYRRQGLEICASSALEKEKCLV